MAQTIGDFSRSAISASYYRTLFQYALVIDDSATFMQESRSCDHLLVPKKIVCPHAMEGIPR